uniref:Uncharacterized protein MANES_09G167300 n=1 Tax=Rhizophora mucronata TaxID=61149 RepID=A0A2P2NZE2_RHIMU
MLMSPLATKGLQLKLLLITNEWICLPRPKEVLTPNTPRAAETMLGSISYPAFTILTNICMASSSKPFCAKPTRITVTETSSSSSVVPKICHASSTILHFAYMSINALPIHKSD